MNYEDKKKKKKEKEIPFGRGLVPSVTVLLFDLLDTHTRNLGIRPKLSANFLS